MSVLPTPACPTCRADLRLQNDDTLDAWVCPEGHGLAFTLSEAYERLQEDEIHEIWQRAKTAPAGQRGCPMCSTTMVSVAVVPDDDERPNAIVGQAPTADAVTLDVCLVDEVLWLDAGEIDELPADLPDPEPTAEEQAQIAAVTTKFGDDLTAGWDAEEAATLTGKLTALVMRSRKSKTAKA